MALLQFASIPIAPVREPKALPGENSYALPGEKSYEVEKFSPSKQRSGFEVCHQFFGDGNYFVDVMDYQASNTLEAVTQCVKDEPDVEKKEHMTELKEDLKNGVGVCRNTYQVGVMAQKSAVQIKEIKSQVVDPQVTEQLALLSLNIDSMVEKSQETLELSIKNIEATYDKLCKKEPKLPGFVKLKAESEKKALCLHSTVLKEGEKEMEEKVEEEEEGKIEPGQQPPKKLGTDVVVSGIVWFLTFAYIVLKQCKTNKE